MKRKSTQLLELDYRRLKACAEKTGESLFRLQGRLIAKELKRLKLSHKAGLKIVLFAFAGAGPVAIILDLF